MKIGPHEVLGEIGRGGIGIVFKARDPQGREVAIKLLQRLDGGRSQRFDRERRLLEALGEKDGFVPLLEAGESAQGPYLVMPFVPGGTLKRRLGRSSLDVEEAIALGIELSLALGRAHALGIVHRDLKPENVIFARDGSQDGDWGRALVLDLGLAKHFRKDAVTAASISLTKTGESMGTIAYMAPEQLADSKSVDPRADVFALGAILYECLAGGPAFEGETTLEVLAKIQTGSFAPLRSRCKEAPRWLAAVIERALAVDPARRYFDASALARALEARGAGSKRGLAVALGAAAVIVAGVAALGAVGIVKGGAPSEPLAPTGTRAPPPPVLAPPAPAPPAAAPPRALYEARTMRLASVWGSAAGRHGGMVLDLKASPDGRLVASSSMDGTVRVWDAEDLRPLHVFTGHGSPVTGVAFLPVQKRILSVGRDRTARVWDLESEKELLRLVGHEGEISGVAVTRDEKLALTAGKDKRIGMWDLASGKLVRWLAGHEEPVTSITLSPDEKTALSASEDGTLRLWDLETGGLVRTFAKQPAKLQCPRFTPDGTKAVCGAQDTVARLFDVASGELLRTFEGHTQWVVSVALSADGRHLLTGSFDQTMRIFSVETGATERVIPGDSGWVNRALWLPGEKRIVSGGNGATVHLWNADDGSELQPPSGHVGPCTCVALTADGRRALTGGYDRALRLWDTESGKEVGTLEGHGSWLRAVAISGDGRRALSSAMGGTRPPHSELMLWDVASGRGRPLQGQTLPVAALGLSPDGRRGVTAGFDETRGEAHAWSFDGEPVARRIPGASAGASSLAFASGGAGVFAGTTAGPQIWDLETLEAGPLQGSTRPITAIAADEDYSLAAEVEGNIIGWNRGDPTETIRLEGHRGGVVSLAIAQSRKLALSAGEDGTVRLWSIERSAEIDHLDLAARGDRPMAVAFFHDGSSFLVTTNTGLVARFEVRLPP
jgi:WD40 repeat protein/tRNA A-37 threonylcarbamoyl transferase component Bud32